MKSKAKPAKGSARTKRFDRGGTVAALAGLGTLAFLLNREKNKQKAAAGASEGPEFKRLGEYPEAVKAAERSDTTGGNEGNKPGQGGRAGTIIPEPDRKLSVESETPREREVNIEGKREPQTRVQTAPQSTEAVPGVDEKTLDRLQRRNVPSGGKKKPATSSAQGSVSTTGVDAGIAAGRAKPKPTPNMGKDNDARPSKSYPEKQARDNKVMKGGTSLLSAESSKQANESVGRARREQMAQLGTSVKKFFKGEPDTEMTSAERRKGQGLTPYAPSGAGEVRRKERFHQEAASGRGIKKGGAVKKYASGGSVSSASKRADGIAQRGKTRGKVY